LLDEQPLLQLQAVADSHLGGVQENHLIAAVVKDIKGGHALHGLGRA
jgi:hypothetical protein